MMPFRVAISTAPDPHGPGRVDMLTHPYTTATCAAGVVTGTAGRDSSFVLSLSRELKDTPENQLDCERNLVELTHDG